MDTFTRCALQIAFWAAVFLVAVLIGQAARHAAAAALEVDDALVSAVSAGMR